MNLRPAALGATLLIAQPAVAQEPLTFKGLEIGSSVERFMEIAPGARCIASRCFVFVSSECKMGRGTTEDFMACRKRYSYGGHIPLSITGTFDENKLVSVYVKISERSFEGLLVAMQERFGPPSIDSRSTLQNRMGASFDNRRVGWERTGTVITITQRAGQVDEGSVFFTSAAYAKKAEEEREQKAKAGAKDL